MKRPPAALVGRRYSKAVILTCAAKGGFCTKTKGPPPTPGRCKPSTKCVGNARQEKIEHFLQTDKVWLPASRFQRLWLRVHSYQILFGSSDQSGLFGRFRRRFGIESVKDRRTNKNGKEEGYNVHTCAEQERLPAADGVKSRAIHWISH